MNKEKIFVVNKWVDITDIVCDFLAGLQKNIKKSHPPPPKSPVTSLEESHRKLIC